MDITFDIRHAFHPISNEDGNADVRRILQKYLVQLNRNYSTNGIGPTRYWVNGRLVVWTLPHVFGPGDSYDENAWALRCLLYCLIELNLSFLKYGGKIVIPTLYESPVYYARTIVWDTIPALYSRGYGDCKSLTAALIAQYFKQGIECAPVFRFMPRADGALNFHILVQTANGFEDPSKIKGMGANEVASISES